VGTTTFFESFRCTESLEVLFSQSFQLCNDTVRRHCNYVNEKVCVILEEEQFSYDFGIKIVS
jgi:hypothetical protein